MILASTRQRGNPVLAHVRHVGIDFGDVRADFVLGALVGALYISLRYYLLHPNYLFARMKELRNCFRTRLLLCQVDVDDNERPIQEISLLAIREQWTLLLAFSLEEAGRYLETFRSYEMKGPEGIMERTESDYLAKLQDVLTQIRAVNKTDVLTLAQTFGSLEAIVNASADELSLCPGLGEKKVRRMQAAFGEPLQTRRQRLVERSQIVAPPIVPALPPPLPLPPPGGDPAGEEEPAVDAEEGVGAAAAAEPPA